MTEHKFRDISEHDMDMLITEEFVYSDEFASLFLSKLNIKNSKLISTWISKTDIIYGESDITIVFDLNGKKIALLIENKIKALAMPEQPSRYFLRGEKGISNKNYDSFYVFIVAPENYLETNEKAKEYPYQISYESIREYFLKLNDKRARFKLAQIDFAIEKQKRGYQAIKDIKVSDFWNKYVIYQKKNYPYLKLSNQTSVHPARSFWPYFHTNILKTPIIYKSDKGYVDLTFNGQAKQIDKIKNIIVKVLGDYNKLGLSVIPTGKSCAVRLVVPYVDFAKAFEDQLDNIKLSFDAVITLKELADNLDIYGIENILNNNPI